VILLYDGKDGWEVANSTATFRPLDGVWIYANTSYTDPAHLRCRRPQPPARKGPR